MKPFSELIAADIVAAGVDKTRLVRNVISELAVLLDADNVAGILIDRFCIPDPPELSSCRIPSGPIISLTIITTLPVNYV